MEDKIEEYLDKVKKPTLNKIMAKDIVEIIEKEYAHNLGFTDLMKENINYKEGWENAVAISYEADSKIVKLEKENADLEEKLKILEGHFDALNEDYQDAVKKIKDLEVKLICRNGRILELEEQIKEYELINKHHIDLIGRQEKQIAELKACIEMDIRRVHSQKYLDRDEVEDFVKEIITIAVSTFNDEEGEPIDDLPIQTWEDFEDDFNRIITAICKLALPIINGKDNMGPIKEIQLGVFPFKDKHKDKHIDVYGKDGEILNNKDNI
uniref:Uncharacterized protein n=1 Tax=viral metagenome TaxID=1070528 RepID=A0A6H1ZDV9_9ZZZZ